jgi:short-subunit dehydrogenase
MCPGRISDDLAARLTQAVLPQMRHQKSRLIINISSVLGFLPAPFMGFYGASKHAVEGYTESLDHEIKTLGVRALVVEPNYTQTQLGHNTQKAERNIADYELLRTAAEESLIKQIQEGDRAEVVAETVLAALNDEHPKHRYPVGRRGRNPDATSALWSAERFWQELSKAGRTRGMSN